MSTESKEGGGDAYSAKKKKGPVFKRRTKKKKQTDGGTGGQTAAQLRVQRDLADLELPQNVKIIRKTDEWMQFTLVMKIGSGYWKGAAYRFNFKIPPKYPFDGPKVICADKIYHPNIDLEGKVCVNVLRPWKPTYSVQIILFGLMFLFTNPNPNDPLNKDAAKDMRDNLDRFKRNVVKSLKGNYVGNVSFPRNDGSRF